VTTSLVVRPVSTDIAFNTVAVVEISTGDEYGVEEVVGTDPSVV